MQTPDGVAAMLRLKHLGLGIKRIARELGCSHMTVRYYVAQGGWLPYRGRRPAARRPVLAGLEDWVAERFRRHGGNADVVRQELAGEKGIRLRADPVCGRLLHDLPELARLSVAERLVRAKRVVVLEPAVVLVQHSGPHRIGPRPARSPA